MSRKGKSDAVRAAKINEARKYGQDQGLAKRAELKKDAPARQEIAADYYRRAKDEAEYDAAERAYYQAYADALMGVQTTEMVVTSTSSSSKKKKNKRDAFEKVIAWRQFFERMFSAPFAVFSFAGGGSGQGGGGGQPEETDSTPSHKPPKLPPVATYVGAFIIGAFLGVVVFGDFGVALVLGGAVTREVYARKADAYNPWVARAIGIIPPALTLLGSMWQFGLALVVHLLVWKQIPYLYQEPEPTEEEKGKEDMPSSM